MLRLDKEEEEQELKLRGSLEFRADFQSLRTFSHSPPRFKLFPPPQRGGLKLRNRKVEYDFGEIHRTKS